ncbi:UDP-glucose--hexose-1-phosphate uridylyltransferase [Clostridium sp. SHJSY1]|uniref:UDP-glucose--hexose-1-phosphate uridylyltransferase n=1 Tax=Clostridium sp. SHJSY1 TaxID=2942483 RepID=UPI002874F281|nr:UDP-glucose--hexose-1-phosphate uridylyltransferase [Clostridium sp. SHJSY1]MDS0525149.1 UDP-glucose--hexose-1-phosphate uridylyltransferase [Clostridium sp. SHJSY1]
MELQDKIQLLVAKAIKSDLIEKQDKVYCINQVMDLFNLKDIENKSIEECEETIPDILDELVDFAAENNIIEDLSDEKDILASKIMNCFMSKPSEIIRNFYKKYDESAVKATDYFYELSKNNNYIQTKRIAKNISYKVGTEYGDLDITINLSKPEKNPKDIAKAKEVKSTNYPKCLLCVENEGYVGRINHPARSNHRIIPLDLLGEDWYLQYSPYSYYNEHCIVLCKEHRDMKINKVAFERLLRFIEKFPHYFVGSNADLPIVGGSILTHDHYQGGAYEFPMAKAEDDFSFKVNGYEDINFAVVKWPLSVMRLRGKDINSLVDASDYILNKWRGYSDKENGIFAFTEETPHNTITPIARKRGDFYEMDLVLRNNRTSEEHPLGIFHPHEDVQHIKKENIGLIEVMGLAVLPARLKTELKEVSKYLIEEENLIAEYHIKWADELKEKYKEELTGETVQSILDKEVGYKFLRVLQDAGVYKRNEEGKEGIKKFIEHLNAKKEVV